MNQAEKWNKKIKRFIVAHDPIDNHTFILHTIKPKCLIEIIKGKLDNENCFHFFLGHKNELISFLIRDHFDDIPIDEKFIKKAFFWFKAQIDDKKILF